MSRVTILRFARAWALSAPRYRALLRRWTAASLPADDKAIAVVLADDAYVQDLNARFRGKAAPTNILSFAGDEESWGDLVLAHGTIAREASEQRKPFLHHFAHLIVHGCLHLQGHDHERPAERRAMEAREIALLAGWGIGNPYEATL